MNKLPLFLVIIVAIIAVAACSRFIQQRKQTASDDRAAVTRLAVVVVDKREYPASDRRSRQQEVTPAGAAMHYEVHFRPQSPESDPGAAPLIYRVNRAQFRTITAGEQGVLRVKGQRFMGFDAQAAR